MNDVSFATADALYRYAYSGKVVYHSVDHPLFHEFWLTSCELDAALRVAGNDELLRQLQRVSRIRFEFAAAPLPFNHPALLRRLSEVTGDALYRKVSLVYPSLAPIVSRFLNLLRELTSCETAPLLDCLRGLVGLDGSATVVTREAKYVEAACSVIHESLGHCEVIDVAELRTACLFERLFIIGSLLWFPDHVFSAPRAPEVHVIAYQWLSRRWQPQQAFLESTAVSEEHASPDIPQVRSEDRELDNWPELDWREISRQALQNSPEAGKSSQDFVETRLFSLSDGLAVFLDVSNRSTSLVIDPEADGDARVRRVPSDEIEIGTFLLRRTEGGGDYILPLADQILGERARPHRAMQRHWKERLREIIAGSSQHESSLRLMDVSLRLIDLGATRADEGNLRYWISSRSISPRDKKDFQAILQLTGLKAQSGEYWTVMRQILAAHYEAGRRIRRGLIQRVRSMDLRQFERHGRIDIVLPDQEGGKLTAFLVEGRAPERSPVPASREGRIFKREDL